jgi:hypothetical protein
MDKTMSDWQATQIFLSDTGVHEVQINLDSARLRCDCPGYSSRSQCKHTRFVKSKMLENDGVYPVEVSNKASAEESEEARLDPSSFRKFLFKYGRVEVV